MLKVKGKINSQWRLTVNWKPERDTISQPAAWLYEKKYLHMADSSGIQAGKDIGQYWQKGLVAIYKRWDFIFGAPNSNDK